MTTKLTVQLDDAVIKKAKKYSRLRKMSLGKIIEEHLKKITDSEFAGKSRKSWVKKSKGILSKRIPKNYDYKAEYYESHVVKRSRSA